MAADGTRIDSAPVRLAVVGAGIMGQKHARVIARFPDARVAVVVDPDGEKGRALADQVGAGYARCLDVVCDPLDAAIIAVPSALHADIGTTALTMGLDVLVEKPIAETVADARRLVAEADARGRILLSGHVERFNPAVTELSRHVSGPSHVDIRRLGPFTPRIATDVILDLMIHDLDLVLALFASEVRQVLAITRWMRAPTEDFATCLIMLANGVSATLTASRVSPAKRREIELTQQDGVVVADLLRRRVIVRGTGQPAETTYLETPGEPLALELRNFIDCVRTRARPLVDGHSGLAALEAAIHIRDQATQVDDRARCPDLPYGDCF